MPSRKDKHVEFYKILNKLYSIRVITSKRGKMDLKGCYV